MGFEQKTAISAAVGAFGVSFLLGLIAGVPFGTALMRGLLFSALFAVVGYGVAIVIRRFLPELLEVASSSGEGVNIVLPGDMDEEEEAFRSPVVGADDELIEEVEEVVRPLAAPEDAGVDDAGAVDPDAAESLPDIDSFGGTFASGEPQTFDGSDSSSGSGSGSQTISDPELGTFDAREIAQAIRTTLLKEGS